VLITGLAKAFNISQHHAVLLLIPLIFSRMMGTCFIVGKLVSSLAASNLLPRFLSGRSGPDDISFYASTVTSLIGLLATLTVQWYQVLEKAMPQDVLVTICGLITYNIQLFGFLILRVKLSRISSALGHFRSPFGIVGAFFSMLVFLLGISSSLVIIPRARNFMLVLISGFLFLPTVYYFMHAKYVQTFSEAEREVMLQAHAEIKNANGRYLFACCCCACC
jgi:amino acid transporter